MIDLTGTLAMAFLLVALCLLLLLWFWQRSSRAGPSGTGSEAEATVMRDQENIHAYKIQLAELERELEQGNLDQTGYQKLLAEMQDQLLEAVDESAQGHAKPKASSSSLLVFNVSLALLLHRDACHLPPSGAVVGGNGRSPDCRFGRVTG